MKQGAKQPMNQNLQKIWLISCLIMIVLMIIVGGYTRLTDSGLSMTSWKPISGILPPMNEVAWQEEFTKYQQSPEFIKINNDFGLAEFKGIFWVEFIHRILGRITGLVIILPFLIFYFAGHLRRSHIYLSMCLLVIFQGLMGWYMVKSGLVDNPHVSHYRLAAHLITALLLYGVILWELFNLTSKDSFKSYFSSILAKFTLLVLSIQIFLGAMVAGLDAGLIYNHFPYMGDGLVPDEFSLSLNAFGNPASVQFIHRCFGYLVTISSLYLAYKIYNYRILLSLTLTAVTVIQVCLGILTLIHMVPIFLALAHQLFAVLYFSIILYIVYIIK